ncbi:MAG: hypothetical protein AVO38_00470 [delta proteobacterium ML8_D]|jgi:apolipoprotein N-acyltransferase|nr:MAG: hypothetical protein AVO38_00470 [delta proteobacterium ML8_D]
MRSGTKFLLVLLSGALLVSSFYGPGFLAWFCLVPYFIVAYYSNLRQTVFFSFLLGLAYFSGVTYWFLEYSFVFWLPILGILASYIIIFGIVLYFIYSKIKWPVLRFILISAVWMAIEFFRNRTFLAFPWGMIAYSQHDYLAVMQMAKITGAYGVSLILILFNTALSESIIDSIKKEKINIKNFRYALPVICLVLIIMVSGFININSYRNDTGQRKETGINIALVQTNISFDDKFEKDSSVLIPEPHSKDEYFNKGTELIVFPESVIWGTLERNKTFGEWAQKTIKRQNLYLITGQILWDEDKNYYNSVVLYSPESEIAGRYNKIHPLPCAEYMPYPDVLGFLSFLNIAKLNITPVREFEMINYPPKGSLGINICFESTLPIIARSFRNNGAEAIFVFTDDAGFKDSLASWQHVIFSRVRAIENGCYVVHSSNMGVSAIIDPVGEISSQTKLGRKVVLYDTIFLNSDRTFYSVYGNVIMYIYFGISLIYLAIYIIHKTMFKKSLTISRQ